MAQGSIAHWMWLLFRQLEDGNQPPAQKVDLAEKALAKTPDVAPLYLFKGKNLLKLNRRHDAETSFRKGLTCVNEPDFKTRLLVDLALIVESAQEKSRLLNEAQELNGNLISAATAALVLKG